jgi:putative serine protease PepD
MRARLILLVVAASLIVSAVTAVLAIQFSSGGGGTQQPTSTSASAPPSSAASSNNAALNSACLSAADIYQQLQPAVVEITSTLQGRNPFAPSGQAAGSGILIDQQGTILTNNHVVADATNLEVAFSDGTTASASVVGTDPGNDLAVIRADVSGLKLTPAPLGD